MRQGIYYCGADSEPGEGAWPRHKGDFFYVVPIFIVFLQFLVDVI